MLSAVICNLPICLPLALAFAMQERRGSDDVWFLRWYPKNALPMGLPRRSGKLRDSSQM